MDGDTRGLGSRAGGGAGRLTRRLLLLGGAAAGVAVLVDRGLRIDVPPPPPPVPTRRRAPDELVLLAALDGLDGVVRAESATLSKRPTAVVRRLRTIGQEQVRVVRGRLTNAGVPAAVIDAAVASTPTAASTGGPDAISAGTDGSSAPSSSPEALGRLLADSVGADAWPPLATAGADTRQLLTAAYAQRLAGAVLLGRELPTPRVSQVRKDLVARTQQLTYAFEVVAAQSIGEQRRTAQATLDRLRRLEASVSTASSTMPAGWALPYPVTTPRAARRLATDTLSSAVDDAAALARSAADAASLEDVAHWSAQIQALAVDWDQPLTAFPGASS